MAAIDETRAIYGRPVVARGREELFQHISGLWGDAGSGDATESGSSIRVEAVGAVEENLDGWFRFRFRWYSAEGETLMMGTDFGRVSADGRFELIVVFLDALE